MTTEFDACQWGSHSNDDNTKIMFENETLVNASPATVSRCGIIYVSDTDLGWTPLVIGWTPKCLTISVVN